MRACAALAAVLGLTLGHAGAAAAAQISYQALASGVSSGSPPSPPGVVTDYTQLPVTDTFADRFTCSNCGSDVLVSDSGSNFNFYDDYVFQVAASTIDAVSSSIDLGSSLSLSNLQMRLYGVSGNSTLPALSGTPAGLLSGSAASGGWSTPMSFNSSGSTGEISVLSDIVLGTGTYVLEVRGDVTGTAGGSYSGSLNLTPVPLPAALPLLLSGIGLIAGAARRRRA